VCFLDDDDHLCHSSLATRWEEAVRRSDWAGVYCDWRTIAPHAGIEHFRPLRRPTRREHATLESLPFGTPFIATAPMLRREVLLDLGGFNEALDRVEDAELWARLFRAGHRVAYVAHIGVVYRQGPATMVSGAPREQLRRLLEVADWLDRTVPIEEIGPAGPMPETRPLSQVKRAADQLPQLLQYLALIAVDEPSQAARLGIDLIPVSLRRRDTLWAHAARLVGTLHGRSVTGSAAAERIVSDLLGDLVVTERVRAEDRIAGPRALHRPLGQHPGRMSAERARVAFDPRSGGEVVIRRPLEEPAQ
jgi:hypothetical protein